MAERARSGPLLVVGIVGGVVVIGFALSAILRSGKEDVARNAPEPVAVEAPPAPPLTSPPPVAAAPAPPPVAAAPPPSPAPVPSEPTPVAPPVPTQPENFPASEGPRHIERPLTVRFDDGAGARVPLPLRQRVRDELLRTEEQVQARLGDGLALPDVIAPIAGAKARAQQLLAGQPADAQRALLAGFDALEQQATARARRR